MSTHARAARSAHLVRSITLLLALLALLAGCGRRDGDPPADVATSDVAAQDVSAQDAAQPDSANPDTVSPTDVATPDAAPAAEANIREALNCGTPAGLGGMTRPNELQAHQVDTRAFPDALCNDGTPAVIYYRPYRGEANRNRWVIAMRGGGGCGGAEECASRWCSCSNRTRCPHAENTTNFDINNMSGGGSRSQGGSGVMLRDGPAPNSLEDYNHVRLVYCSSDSWRGNARGVTFSTTHPQTGAPVTYTMHFLGARILDADLAILRQDGASALSYTLGGAATPMPDLDDATEVVMVGDSAGGAGVIHNLDYITSTLRAHHTGCDGSAACPPEVVGIIDAVVGPDLSRLDWSRSAGADAGVDTYAEFAAVTERSVVNMGARREESCVSWHREHRPGTEGECNDISHLVRHHVTTPFFVRMALADSLISRNYEESGLADPELGPFVPDANGVPRTFAVVLQRELAQFPSLPSSAEEGASIATAPGVFAPSCSNHDTIHTDSEVFGVTIDPTGTRPYRFFDVYDAWRSGGSPSAVLSSDPMRRDTVCPPL